MRKKIEYRIEPLDGRFIILDSDNSKLGDYGDKTAAEERMKTYRDEEQKLRYPVHTKLAKVSADSQKIGEFLEWLTGQKRLVIAKYPSQGSDRLIDAWVKVDQILAEYFGIDLAALEQEKRQMLAELR